MSDVAIPPVTVLGPIEAKRDELIDRVRENLHVIAGTVEDPELWVPSAVDSAIGYVIDYSNRNSVGLPDDALTCNGIVGFATRIYQDAFAPRGVQLAISDAIFEPVFTPEHLFKHWRHYFLRLYVRWGVA